MLDIPDIVVSMSLAKPALFPASQEKTRAEKSEGRMVSHLE